MIAILLPRWDDRLADALVFQKYKDFRVYVPADTPQAEDYQGRLNLVTGGLNAVTEPLTCIWEPGAAPDQDFLRRVARSAERHEDYDVFHVNVLDQKPFPRKTGWKRLFRILVEEEVAEPLSAFVFRTARLREKAVFVGDGDLDPVPTLLACARQRPVRNVWRQTLIWTAPELARDPASEEQRVLRRMDLLRWTETFYGADDYPLSPGDRMDLFANCLARLFPSYSEEALKPMMNSFQVSQGPLRKMRAAHALSSAIKARLKQLQ